jgi:hypothetical protein
MKNNQLIDIKDFNTLDKLKQIYMEQFQNKYDFDLYIAPLEKEMKEKFELLFVELEYPYEKLFDSSLLKKAFSECYLAMPLALYVFLGEEQEDGLFRQSLAEFISILK